MICTGCGLTVAPGTKYIAAFVGPWGDLSLKVGCAHREVPDLNYAAGVFGSGGCLLEFMIKWETLLKTCRQHEEETAGEAAPS